MTENDLKDKFALKPIERDKRLRQVRTFNPEIIKKIKKLKRTEKKK